MEKKYRIAVAKGTCQGPAVSLHSLVIYVDSNRSVTTSLALCTIEGATENAGLENAGQENGGPRDWKTREHRVYG